MRNKLLVLSLITLLGLPLSVSGNSVTSTSKRVEVNYNKLQLNQNTDFHGETLTIYNCADYIDETLLREFENRYNCKVNYYTFDTNETMYNQLTLQPEGTYDLLCPSEYMIQRLVREGLVEEINIEEECPVYARYATTTVRNKLKGMKADTDGDGIKDASLDNYAAGYMWGTLGIIYDPYCNDTIREDVKSWDVFWDSQYNDLISIKNSMRDTFVVGLMHGYKNGAFSSFENIDPNARETFLNEISRATSKEELEAARSKYNATIQGLFDLIIESEDYQKTIEIVKKELISLKSNIFGLEVDSGKNDIVTGKIKMNLAWSGDAVYSIDVAMEEQNKVLEYYVPEDGSNVWYDGWVLPKKAKRELACKFIDFLSEPSNAALNMEYIGYTSFIACDEVFDLVNSWYGNTDIKEFDINATYSGPSYDETTQEEIPADVVYYQGKYYVCNNGLVTGILPTDANYYTEVSKEDLGVGEPYDLGFIFDDKLTDNRRGVIYPYVECVNQLIAQYPDEDTIARCAVMNDFANRNDDVVIMWSQVKAYTNMVSYYVILGTSVSAAIVFFAVNAIRKNKSTRNKRRLEKISVK